MVAESAETGYTGVNVYVEASCSDERARVMNKRYVCRRVALARARRLDEDEVKRLKRARREGDYHEQLLVLKVKNKHDKYG